MPSNLICQSTCDSWVLVMFTFIVDLVPVNTTTILKYNKANCDDARKVFLRNLSIWLMIPYIKETPKVKNLISDRISAINDVLATCSEVKTMILKQWHSTDLKSRECQVCIKNICGIEDIERQQQKGHLFKMKKKCKNCKKERCPNHRSKKVESGSRCERCSLSWNSIIFSRGFLFYTAKN